MYAVTGDEKKSTPKKSQKTVWSHRLFDLQPATCVSMFWWSIKPPTLSRHHLGLWKPESTAHKSVTANQRACLAKCGDIDEGQNDTTWAVPPLMYYIAAWGRLRGWSIPLGWGIYTDWDFTPKVCYQGWILWTGAALPQASKYSMAISACAAIKLDNSGGRSWKEAKNCGQLGGEI